MKCTWADIGLLIIRKGCLAIYGVFHRLLPWLFPVSPYYAYTVDPYGLALHARGKRFRTLQDASCQIFRDFPEGFDAEVVVDVRGLSSYSECKRCRDTGYVIEDADGNSYATMAVLQAALHNNDVQNPGYIGTCPDCRSGPRISERG